MTKASILFVDSDSNLLQSMKRSVHDMRGIWRCSFVSSAADGLAILEREPVSLVVSNVRMSEMDGLTFLGVVRDRWPGTLRIVMSGETTSTIGVRALQAACQCVSKPCGVEDLKRIIKEMIDVQSQLGDGLIHQRIVQLNRLPSLPSLYLKLREQLDDLSVSAGDVAETIGQDPAMGVKVLQLANSAYFGGRGSPIVAIEDAVKRVGIAPITDMALAAEAFSSFRSASCPNFNQALLWESSRRISSLARKIAAHERLSKQEQEVAALAGLLHGLGKLIMAVAMPHEYSDFLELPTNEITAAKEREVFGSTHATLGGYLGGLWGLPSDICQTIAYYAEPAAGPKESRFSPRAAVHIAASLSKSGPSMDLEFVENLQKVHCIQDWQDLIGKG